MASFIAGYSDWLNERMLNNIFFNSIQAPTWESQDTLYFGLWTQTYLSEGIDGKEVTFSAGYARAPVHKSQWYPEGITNTPGGPNITKVFLNEEILFPEATSSWGVVRGFGIYDETTGGNILIGSVLAYQKTIRKGDTPYFPGKLQGQRRDGDGMLFLSSNNF